MTHGLSHTAMILPLSWQLFSLASIISLQTISQKTNAYPDVHCGPAQREHSSVSLPLHLNSRAFFHMPCILPFDMGPPNILILPQQHMFHYHVLNLHRQWLPHRSSSHASIPEQCRCHQSRYMLAHQKGKRYPNILLCNSMHRQFSFLIRFLAATIPSLNYGYGGFLFS